MGASVIGVPTSDGRISAQTGNTLKSINFDFLAGQIGTLIDRLAFTDNEIARVNASFGTDAAVMEDTRQNARDADERKKKKLREDLMYLADNRLPLLKAGVYTPDTYVTEEARLNTELTALCPPEPLSADAFSKIIETVQTVSELVKNVAVTYVGGNPHEKDRIARVIFSELTVSQNSFDFQCTNGFKPLSARFVPGCDPKVWLSELALRPVDLDHTIEVLHELITPSEPAKKVA